jgi:two-component system chemotaxis response regulator CheB
VTINAERQVRDVVVVAASAGGFSPLRAIAAAFPAELPAGIAVVLHRGVHDDPTRLVTVLKQGARLHVVEPGEGDPFQHGSFYVAPMDRHLVFLHGRFHRSQWPKEHYTRPAADPLFRSAAHDFGSRVLAVVLSGYDADGALGAKAVSDAGGITLVQTPAEADVPSMPQSTIAIDHVAAALPLERLLEAIPVLARGEAFEA